MTLDFVTAVGFSHWHALNFAGDGRTACGIAKGPAWARSALEPLTRACETCHAAMLAQRCAGATKHDPVALAAGAVEERRKLAQRVRSIRDDLHVQSASPNETHTELTRLANELEPGDGGQ